MATEPGQNERYPVICPHCGRQVMVRAEWLDRDVQCPLCSHFLCVPQPSSDGYPPRAEPATGGGSLPPGPNVRVRGGVRFNFGCPRCQALLEARSDAAGQSARCPTCNAEFPIPELDPYTGKPMRLQLVDGERQDPTPMHAYAASGHQAPRIVRADDGTPLIECRRCKQRTEISRNNCTHCGAPFSTEGVSLETGKPGERLATVALILGICSVPAFCVPVGPIAVICGMGSWLRSTHTWPTGTALAGMLLGLVGAAEFVFFLL